MTDEQINVAIDQVIGKNDGECGCCDCRQDWCNDLNAMHEAEKALTVEEWSDYVDYLPTRWEEAIHTTARQRAEAFLRTLGKWEATTEESSADGSIW
jgi:hypothetical protein